MTIVNCKRCGREAVMYAKGLCQSCYVYYQRKKKPFTEEEKQKRKEYYKTWYSKPENKKRVKVAARINMRKLRGFKESGNLKHQQEEEEFNQTKMLRANENKEKYNGNSV